MNFVFIIVVTVLALLSVPSNVSAQSLEPLPYISAPVGINFLVAGYQNSNGALGVFWQYRWGGGI